MRARRSGIANLVGAVFFILIVVLMVGALAAMFLTFNGFVEGQHTSEATTLQAQQAAVNVQNVTFGGLTSYNGLSYQCPSTTCVSSSANGDVNLIANTNHHPLLPITNSNFTDGMAGWTTSHAYKTVSDSATVQLTPQLITYNDTFPSAGGSSPSTLTFQLNVVNNDPNGSPLQIAKVSLLVDQNWGVPGSAVTCPVPGPCQPTTLNWGSTPLATGPPSVVGNNITWVSLLPIGVPAGGICPADCQIFTWTANVPRTYGTFFDTVVLSWTSSLLPPAVFTDTAIATVNETVTQVEVSHSGTTGVSSANVNPAPAGTASSGLTLGYDANPLRTTLPSGPGSLFTTFAPSLNSAPIPDGQQLTATADFTTTFSLDTATAQGIMTAGCCTLTWDSSLDNITSARNSLVYYQAYLTNPNGLVDPLPIGGVSCGASPSSYDYMNPTTVNDFGSSGWVLGQVCFNPSTAYPAWLNHLGFWYPGAYTFTIVVTMIVPGAFPDTAGYPPSLSINLDNIELAFSQVATTYYGQTTFQIPTGLNFHQIQGLEVLINATGADQNTTIYSYVTDNSRFVYNPTYWVPIGSASFVNSGTIDSVVGLPNAAYYVNSTAHTQLGKPEVGDLVVRVNATSSVPLPLGQTSYTVNLQVYAVIQTFNQTRLTVELQNQSPAPIRLLSMVITGPGAALTVSFTPTAPFFYFSQGEKIILPETFTWIPGQTYTVTVTTESGLSFSRSFPAPLA